MFMFGKRKQAKMQQLQDPIQSNVDSLKNAKREVTRPFRKKRTISESQNF